MTFPDNEKTLHTPPIATYAHPCYYPHVRSLTTDATPSPTGAPPSSARGRPPGASRRNCPFSTTFRGISSQISVAGVSSRTAPASLPAMRWNRMEHFSAKTHSRTASGPASTTILSARQLPYQRSGDTIHPNKSNTLSQTMKRPLRARTSVRAGHKQQPKHLYSRGPGEGFGQG